MKKYWKKLFLKYFDFNNNEKIDLWEIVIVIVIIFIFEVLSGVISNIIVK